MNTFILDRRWLFSGVMTVVAFAGLMYAVAFAAIGFGSVSSNANSSSGASTIVIDKPSSTAEGDFLIAGIAFDDGEDRTITPPSGWTLIERTDNNDYIGFVTYWKIAGGSEGPSYSWGITSSDRAAGGIIRYTGVDTSNPIDDSAENEGHSTTLTAPSVTTTGDDHVVVMFFAEEDDEDLDVATSTTERYDVENSHSSGPRTSAVDFTKASAGPTGTKAIEIDGGNERWITQTVALKVAPPSGTVVIVKNALPDDAQNFDFTSDVTGNTAFSLDDDADGTLSNTKTMTSVPVGTYTVTEGAVSGWTLTDLTCTGDEGDSVGNEETGVATIDLDVGETITCTYTNTKHGSITIEKQTLPDGDEADFTFAGDVSGTLSDDESATVSDLMPDSYTSTETVPAGWDLTDISCDDEGSGEDIGTGTATFDLDPGEDITCVFTNTKRGQIHIEKFADPLGQTFGFTMNGPDVEESTELTINSEDGATDTFDNLPAGSGYSVSEEVPDGWSGDQDVSCLSGEDNVNPNDFPLPPGGEIYCTFNNTEYAVIAGRKFEDMNADGESGESEEGLDGWTINLYQYDEEDDEWYFEDSDVTNEEGGAYSFSSLLPGSYRVCEEGKENWYQSMPSSQSVCGEGEDEEQYGYEFTLGAGVTEDGIDFGNYKYGKKIEGKKFEDVDGDGIKDGGDDWLSGWTIYLDLNGNNALDDGEPYDETDGGGKYKFDQNLMEDFGLNLIPGSYTVREVLQGGWTQTAPNGDEHNIVLYSDDESKDNHFGNFESAYVSGYKWEDADGDGYWDEGEYGLSGWTIRATNEDDDEKTNVTDENGYYIIYFGPTELGEWTVFEDLQNGWLQTYPEDGSYDVILEGSGDSAVERDFGNWKYPVVTGYKWNDLDGDGMWDENESAIEGWAMALGKRGTPEGEEQPIPIEIVALSLTGSNGAFSLTATTTGNYEVFEESQNGWTPTHPAARDSFFDITYDIDVGGRSFNIDSFFDVFADINQLPSGYQIQYDDHDQQIRFGNHYTPPETGGGETSPETIPPAGNGPIVGPGGIGVGGQVLGASIGPGGEETGEVLGEATCSEPLLTQYLGPGRPGNDPAQVTLLQNFLNGEVAAGLPVTGYYGPLTMAAVNTFQLKYWQEVLAPWVPFGLPTDHTTTGFVGKLSLWKVNSLICPGLDIPVPQIP